MLWSPKENCVYISIYIHIYYIVIIWYVHIITWFSQPGYLIYLSFDSITFNSWDENNYDILANLKYKTHFVQYSQPFCFKFRFICLITGSVYPLNSILLILPHWEMLICILGTFLYCFVLTSLLSCMNSLYVRSNIPLVISQYFSFCSLHFHFVVFLENLFNLMWSCLFVFLFVACALEFYPRTHC